MNLEKAILQERFGSEEEKLMINIIFTSNFINLQTSRIFKSFIFLLNSIMFYEF